MLKTTPKAPAPAVMEVAVMSSTETIDPHLDFLQQLGDKWDVEDRRIGDGWRRNPPGCPFCAHPKFFFNTISGAFLCISCDKYGFDIRDFHAVKNKCSREEATRALIEEWNARP